MKKIIIWGAGHGIGLGLVKEMMLEYPNAEIYACYRRKEYASQLLELKGNIKCIEINPIKELDRYSFDDIKFDLCLVAIGHLHDDKNFPEKSIRSFEYDYFMKCMEVNAYLPLSIAKSILPHMTKGSCFAVISAKVGSIEDNRIGGWYSYRSSKAALNMLLKNFSIELSNRHKDITVLSLHPGTVDTQLSKPFTGSVSHEVFTIDQCARYLLKVIQGRTISDSGGFYSWDGQKLPY